MNCKKIQELIITDYIDQQLPTNKQEEIKTHIKNCPECLEFESTVRTKAMKVFKETTSVKTPDYIWNNIQEKINSKETIGFTELLKNKLANLFVLPKPAYAIAGALTAILLITPFFIIKQDTFNSIKEENYLVEQFESINTMDNENDIIGIDIFFDQTT